ncbi:MAG: hypothetical protein AAGC64_04620 [Bacteroidota bacterium]
MKNNTIKKIINYLGYFKSKSMIFIISFFIRDKKGLMMEVLLKEVELRKKRGALSKYEIKEFYKRYQEIENVGTKIYSRAEYKILKEKYLRLKGIQKEENKPFLLFKIIPKNSRSEAIADLQEMIVELKKLNHRRFYIRLIILLHLVSIIYFALFVKLKRSFYPSVRQSKME